MKPIKKSLIKKTYYMLITNISRITGISHTLDIPIDRQKLEAWVNNPEREHIQFVFPELSAEHREFILTGITPEEWKEYIDVEEMEDDAD